MQVGFIQQPQQQAGCIWLQALSIKLQASSI